jgi:D-methionine transport system permease protein
LIVGSAEGAIAAIIPLTLAATPYFALLCEEAIQSVPTGIVETARSIGASPTQIIYKVLLPEALPNIIKGLTSMLVHLVGYSTIAGAIGSGGLGELMIHKGYQTFHWEYVLITVAMMIALVRIIQSCGDYIANGTASSSSNVSL